MIVTATQIRLIQSGAMTQIHVPMPDNLVRWRKGELHNLRVYRAPEDRKKDEKAGPVICQVRILATEQRLLRDLLEDDANLAAEGYQDPSEARDDWSRINWTSTEDDKPVLAVQFKVNRDEPIRLLAAHHGRKFTGDYVSSAVAALPDEPEAVDKDWQDRFTRRAQDLRDAKERHIREEQNKLSLEERLAKIRAEAASHGIDITRQEASIRQRIRALEEKVRKRAA